jgi:two-component system cell cycle response regulator
MRSFLIAKENVFDADIRSRQCASQPMSYKILTVDDSRMVRMIVTKTFLPYGCEVYEAGNGTDALVVAEAVLPDLIFLDITMADMSGLEVLEKMRQIESLQATPVIMLTAESGNNSIERADRWNIAGYISKPFKPQQLLSQASQILALQSLVTT